MKIVRQHVEREEFMQAHNMAQPLDNLEGRLEQELQREAGGASQVSEDITSRASPDLM